MKGLLGKAAISFAILSVVLLTIFVVTFVLPSKADSGSAIWTTDINGNSVTDFSPTQTVYVHGSGFAAGTTYLFKVTRPDGTVVSGDGSFAPWPTAYDYVTSVDGSLQYNYVLDGILGTYTVEVLDSNNVTVASTTFTDATSTDFSQCANDLTTGQGAGPGICSWIGSILQGGNSVYYEGMTVPQRILFRGVNTNGQHIVSFKYSYTKGGTHAYDFMTTVNPSTPLVQGVTGQSVYVPGITDINPCAYLTGPDLTACNALYPGTPIQVTIPNDPFDSKDSAPAPGTGSTQTAKEQTFETSFGGLGSRKVTVYASSTPAFTSPSVTLAHDVAANGDTGDSFTLVNITFTSSGCSNSNPCNYLIFLGGHLAVSGNNQTGFNWGTGLGSSNINGGPYHFKDLNFDGVGGSLDNQIQGSSVLLPPAPHGSIILDKATIPSGDTTSFIFTTTGLPAPTSPSLTDASTPVTWSNLTDGRYNITETVPSNWTLTSAICTGATLTNIASITNGISINLTNGENIICTFTDVKNPKITITPNGTNAVGTPHTFTVTVGQQGSGGFVPVPDGTPVTVSITPSGYTLVSNTCASPGTVSGQCTVVINSTSAGIFTAHASVSVTIGGHLFTISTDSTGENSGNAVKTYVDASIALSPLTAFNKVGQIHTITAHVTQNNGTGVTNVNGARVNFTITSGSATFVGNNYCITNSTGQCSIQINSSSTGSNTIDAITNFNVGGVSLTRSTNGNAGPDGTGSASKTYVNARISIIGNATNEVGTQHTFTITVEKDIGSGWTGVSAVKPTVSFTPSPPGTVTDNCASTGTNSSGQCTVVINSAVAGIFTASASASVNVNGVVFNLITNGISPNSGTATKTYVDAKIILSPLNATNNINQAHTITATVMENPGTGFVAASGVVVTFTLPVNTAGATFVGGINTCTTNSSGQCSVQINSSTPGSVNIHAYVNVTIGSLTLHRETDGTHGSSSNANKVYVAGKIIINKITSPSGSSQSFDYTTTGTGYSGFSLTDGHSNDSGFLVPGTYSVTESAVTGWDLTGLTCNATATTNLTTGKATINLVAGEVISCSFTNTQRGHLIVYKVTDPASDTTTPFPISASGTGSITAPANTTIKGGSSHDYEVTPGTYSVAETVPAGWYMYSNNCTSVSIAAGQTKTCLITNVQIKSLIVSKTAATSLTRNYTWTIDKSVTPGTLNLFAGDSTNSTYTVNVTKTGSIDSNWAVSGTITINNPNGIAPLSANITSVSDMISPSITGTFNCGVSFPYTLVAGANLTCNYTASLSDNTTRTNNATVATSGLVPGGSGTASVDFSSAAINEVNKDINVTDTNGGSWHFTDSGTQTYTKAFDCSGVSYTNNFGTYTHDNTAKIIQTNQSDSASVTVNCYQLNVTKNATTSYTRTFNWTIDKSVTPGTLNLFAGDTGTSAYTVNVTKDAGTDSAWLVSGTITIHNPAPMTATINSVSDMVSGVGSATVNCGSSAPYTLATGADLICTYTRSLSDATSRTNNATATLQNSPSGTTDFSGSTAVTFGNPTTLVNDNITVNDTNGGSWQFSGSGSQTYNKTFDCSQVTYTNNFANYTYDNTATINQTGQSDSASVTVNCYQLNVTKTATTALDHTWGWSIKKIGDQSTLTLAPNETLPVNYTVTVNSTGSIDSNWAVNGTITIHNPAPISATINSVSDIVSGVGVVTANCGVSFPYTLAAGGTLSCTYSSSLSDATSRTNNATATLQNSPSGTTDFSGSASVDFSGATVNDIDECINVSDTYAGNLGTVCKNQTLPKTFNYTRNAGPYNSSYCGIPQQVNNTASFITNDKGATGNSNWSVNVTVACVCSLTQGYWKTHSIYGPAAHPDATWYNISTLGPDTIFFLSGQTYLQVLQTSPQGGNAYYILAHQYIAAQLNSLKGAYMSPTVLSVFNQATGYFNNWTPDQIAIMKGKNGNTLRSQFIYDAGILGAFNEGSLNPAGHCSE